MNYQHSYHAGSFTDVFKHIVLLALIKSFLHKKNGFCYLDTHAGRGYYDLLSQAAKKTKEHTSGITQLMLEKNPPALINDYLNCVHDLNNRLTHSVAKQLRFYPGSPAFMQHLMRPEDRMVLTELHPQENQHLKKYVADEPRVGVHLLDGYQALKAFLPPKERRGLILIDPPYEQPNEYAQLNAMLPVALKKFPTGVYAIWYPIKDRPPVERFYRTLKENISAPLLVTELSIYPENSPLHLNGSGMIIINPPWKIDDQLNACLPWLWEKLSKNQQGHHRVHMLT